MTTASIYNRLLCACWRELQQGENSYNTHAADLTGQTRVLNEVIDIGAYETEGNPHAIDSRVDDNSHSMNVYPNPGKNGKFTLNIGNEVATSVSVFDNQGRLIDTAYDVKDKEYNLNLATGTHFLEAITENGIKTLKVIVKQRIYSKLKSLVKILL